MKNKRKAKPQNPVTQYKHCPACKSKSLIHLEVDVICGDCDWLSAEAYVDSGGMDNIFAACLEHFNIGPEEAPAPEELIVECELDLAATA